MGGRRRSTRMSSVGVSEIDDSNFLVGVISPIEKHEPTKHFDLNGTPVLIWDGCIPFAEGIVGKRLDEIQDALLVVSAGPLKSSVDLVTDEDVV